MSEGGVGVGLRALWVMALGVQYWPPTRCGQPPSAWSSSCLAWAVGVSCPAGPADQLVLVGLKQIICLLEHLVEC